MDKPVLSLIAGENKENTYTFMHINIPDSVHVQSVPAASRVRGCVLQTMTHTFSVDCGRSTGDVEVSYAKTNQ